MLVKLKFRPVYFLKELKTKTNVCKRSKRFFVRKWEAHDMQSYSHDKAPALYSWDLIGCQKIVILFECPPTFILDHQQFVCSSELYLLCRKLGGLKRFFKG